MATHSGSFHADDVFGVAVLAAVFPDHAIVRTRDAGALAAADFAVDVGGEWDPARGRFDHHQRGFDGARTRLEADGRTVPAEGYAGAGLVWREFGSTYVAQAARALGRELEAGTVAAIAADVDAALVRYLDLVDTGAADVAPGIFGISSQVALLNTTWLEEQGLGADALAALQLERFRQAMAFLGRSLERFVLRAIGQVLAADSVRRAERLFDGRVLLLADGGMPWTRVVVREMPQVQLVVYPESGRPQYQIRTVPAAEGTFASRIDLPRAWAGLRDQELVDVTGVADAVFCHLNLFIAGARSREGALRLAQLALDGAAGDTGEPGAPTR
ncbi:MYG1 family protein [Ramlibacter sp. MAH-25]|uniref:MYG1 family protein n=1 Tax=Ramlibacter pinisoli TaxID=2682844 RepID=A0A6N8ITV8_9BURK|nr:MYG1 family protein [Ramlibacter sp. CGMCC 1.13660]MVQ29343.1 MYG1 family protein [Ramlibacter pinisoli]